VTLRIRGIYVPEQRKVLVDVVVIYLEVKVRLDRFKGKAIGVSTNELVK
jgi:hypothetical protein